MLLRPAFPAHLRPRVVAADEVILQDERESRLLRGPACGLIADLVDGQRTADEIVDALDGQAAPENVYYALERLRQKGYLQEARDVPPSAEEAFWSSLGVEPATARNKLRRTTVALRCLGGIDATALVEALGRLRVRVQEHGAILVALVDDYRNPGLETLNRDALRRRRPWMLLRPTGRILWIGPIFRPRQTACRACLEERLTWNRMPPPSAVPPALPVTTIAALHLAAAEIAKWIVLGKNETLEGCIWTLDMVSLASSLHRVARRPQCPACGGKGRERHSPRIRLEARPKTPLPDGGYRSCPPEDTLRRLEPHLSPITGIVPSLDRRPGGAFPVFVAMQQFSDLTHPALGKGMTEEQARASCLAEAVERYSIWFHGDEPRKKCTLDRLGDQAIHAASLLHFSDAQYRRRRDWNRRHPHPNQVGEPFDESRAIDWTPCWSLTRRETRYLPSAFCYLNYPVPEARRFCRADSNGCAAGNTIEEAVLQGFLELVERDAIALWWYNRLRRPAVDLESFDDPRFLLMRSHLAALGRPLDVLDLTTDLDIPVFAAVSSPKRRGASVLLGFGAHLEARLAVSRALTELNQLLVFAKPNLAAAPHFLPAPGARRTAADYNYPSTDDLRQDIRWCVKLAARRGIETLVVDMTRPETGFPVVRVVAPGLRPAWARLGPGRLYDVPVALGWLAGPHSERDLNPVPFAL